MNNTWDEKSHVKVMKHWGNMPLPSFECCCEPKPCHASPTKPRHGILMPNPLSTSVRGDLTVRPKCISCRRSPCLLHAFRLKPAPSELHPMWGDTKSLIWHHTSNIHEKNDIQPTYLSFNDCLEIHKFWEKTRCARNARTRSRLLHDFAACAGGFSSEHCAVWATTMPDLRYSVWRGGPYIPPRHACHRLLQMWVIEIRKSFLPPSVSSLKRFRCLFSCLSALLHCGISERYRKRMGGGVREWRSG